MTIEYKCACGRTHYAKTKEVQFSDRIVADLTSYVAGLIKGGSIAILYDTESNETADKIRGEFEKSDYQVSMTAFSEDKLEYACEDSNLVIGIGGDDIADVLADMSRTIFVADRVCSPFAFAREYMTIFVDMTTVKASPLGEIAGGYGRFMTALLCVLDYRFYSVCYKAEECVQVFARIEKEILDLFDRSYIYYKDDKFIIDLVHSMVQVGLYESMLESYSLMSGYDTVSDNLATVMAKSVSRGEADMLVGWYAFNLLKVIFRRGEDNLCYPADLNGDSELLNAFTGRALYDIFANFGELDAEKITRIRYVLSEYRVDILGYIDGIWHTLENAMRNFRRIYYDAGFGLAESVTLDRLSEVVSASFSEINNFSILKCLHLDGVA